MLKQRFGGDFKKSDDLILPEVFNLVEGKCSTEELVQQIFKDYYSGNVENAFLGFDELRSRGLEGESAIRFLAMGTDDLATIAKKISEKPNMPSGELENILGIKRFGNIIDVYGVISTDELKTIFHYLKEKYGLDLDFSSFVRLVSGQNNKNAHINGEIENHLINTSATFGASEPSYLELIGQREILRMRKGDPKFLLLGSLGVHSARDFLEYSRKINPKIDAKIIDIHHPYTKIIKEDLHAREELADNNKVVTADAKNLPFKGEAFDHVYTNCLFHYIDRDMQYFGKSTDDALRELFDSVAFVLKQGGSFNLVESKYGGKNINEVSKGIEALAKKSGFKLVDSFAPLTYMTTNENGAAIIDESGVPHYGNVLLRRENTMIAKRFIKKNK